jgi:hypothetical protein
MIVVTMPMTLAMKKIVVGCSASYPHAARVVAEAFGVVAEAHGAGRAAAGGGVVCGTLACVLRTSEPAAVAFGGALSGGGIAAYATGWSHRAQGPRPFPLFAF